MRVYVDLGIDFEKPIIGLLVNKCHLKQIASPTPDMVAKALKIQYYTELRW
ncbi:hypothetical protein ES703_117775 [subsurface metagenome]